MYAVSLVPELSPIRNTVSEPLTLKFTLTLADVEVAGVPFLNTQLLVVVLVEESVKVKEVPRQIVTNAFWPLMVFCTNILATGAANVLPHKIMSI